MRIKKNLDEAIYEKLLDSILAARWNSGDVISIESICGQYEVSRTPVVQAIKRLTAEGLTEFLPNGKVRFPLFDEKQVNDVCFVRKLIELTAGQIICENKFEVATPELHECMLECSRHKRHGEFHLASQADLNLHMMIVRGTGNDYLADLYALAQKKFMAINYLNKTENDVVTDTAISQHESMFVALKNWDYHAFKVVIEQHLGDARAKILECKHERIDAAL